jgi:hypothetical protein
MIGRENDDEAWNLDPGEHGSRGRARIEVSGVWRDDGYGSVVGRSDGLTGVGEESGDYGP